MQPVRHVVIRLKRDLPQPVGPAFAWLTDFEDKDAQRAGAVVESRRVVLKTPERVVYEGETLVLGRRMQGRVEIDLLPPDRWEARVTDGPRKGSAYSYRLEPTRDGLSRLRVEYRFAMPTTKDLWLLRLAKPLVKRSLHKMWDGYIMSMHGEVPPSVAAGVPPLRA